MDAIVKCEVKLAAKMQANAEHRYRFMVRRNPTNLGIWYLKWISGKYLTNLEVAETFNVTFVNQLRQEPDTTESPSTLVGLGDTELTGKLIL